MKKYITLAALLAAGATFANAVDTWTFTTKNGTSNGGSQSGIVFTLKESSDRYNVEKVTSDLPTEFSLNSIEIKARDNQSIASGVFIYITDDANGYLGKSETTIGSAAAGGFAKFEFSDLTLSAGTTYRAYFLTNIADIGEDIQAGEIVPVGKYNSQALATIGGFNSATVKDLGVLGHQGVIVSQDYAPNVKITATAAPVPEPSAFGLLAGLGALALVASRRRRK